MVGSCSLVEQKKEIKVYVVGHLQKIKNVTST
jgi:hypothetical protein